MFHFPLFEGKSQGIYIKIVFLTKNQAISSRLLVFFEENF
jgi:hypothetical protein